jgi:phosphoribosylanthranilate isomerase
MRTRVKICGITRPQDALAAARHGADAIGLVFYPDSPRAVDIATAQALVRVLPPFVSVVGLFVNAQPHEIRQVLGAVPIDLLQFHGQEPVEACRGYGRPYIKAVAMRDEVDLVQLAQQYSDAAGLLVDTWHPAVAGGSGETFDWERLPATLALPLILAGGLSPENVALAVQQVKPYAVDVSSGVEQQKGIKDEAKIVRFMQEVVTG